MFLLFSFFFVDDGFRLVPLARVLLSLSLFLSLPIEREREQKAQSRNYFFLSLSRIILFVFGGCVIRVSVKPFTPVALTALTAA